MAEGDEEEDKQYEATQKKLDDARRKGELPKSADLTTAASYAGLILAAMTFGQQSLLGFGATLAGLIGRSDQFSQSFFTGGGTAVSGEVMVDVAARLSPWFAIPAMLALAAVLVQRAMVFAPEKLVPKPNRISLVSNAKNKFGRNGLFEFAKSLTKLLVYSLILGVFLVLRLPEMLAAAALTPAIAVTVLLRLAVEFLWIVLVIALVIGGIDLLWQRAEHLRKNRMSRKELTDEAKTTEGDPHIRQQRRQRAIEIATNKMLVEVRDADVVVVNPTHFAVALKWARQENRAPVCVAKGTDEIAARIRAVAAEEGVPIHHDPPTARALYGTIDIGEEVLPEHYRPVAAAIRFAEAMRLKARARGQWP